VKEFRMFSDEELRVRGRGLSELKSVLDGLRIRFLLTDGVLLGAVREKNFIRWDWDAEVSVYTEEFAPRFAEARSALEQAGFQIGTVNQDEKNLKLNVHKYDNKYSLTGYYLDGDMRRRTQWQIPARFFESLQDIEFQGQVYRCPSPPEAYLEYVYGEWRTPKKETRPEHYLMPRVFNQQSIIHRLWRWLAS